MWSHEIQSRWETTDTLLDDDDLVTTIHRALGLRDVLGYLSDQLVRLLHFIVVWIGRQHIDDEGVDETVEAARAGSESLGSAIKTMVITLKVYTDYMTNLENNIEILRKSRKNKEFSKFLD